MSVLCLASEHARMDYETLATNDHEAVQSLRGTCASICLPRDGGDEEGELVGSGNRGVRVPELRRPILEQEVEGVVRGAKG